MSALPDLANVDDRAVLHHEELLGEDHAPERVARSVLAAHAPAVGPGVHLRPLDDVERVGVFEIGLKPLLGDADTPIPSALARLLAESRGWIGSSRPGGYLGSGAFPDHSSLSCSLGPGARPAFPDAHCGLSSLDCGFLRRAVSFAAAPSFDGSSLRVGSHALSRRSGSRGRVRGFQLSESGVRKKATEDSKQGGGDSPISGRHVISLRKCGYRPRSGDPEVAIGSRRPDRTLSQLRPEAT